MSSSTASSVQPDTTAQLGLTVYSTHQGIRVPERGTMTWDILNAMKQGTRLTPLMALNRFNCLSLSQRVGELKRQGWPILSRTISLPNGKHCSEYWMA